MMAYSLADKITDYLADCGIEGATIREMIIAIPHPSGGEVHRRVDGLVTPEKLDAIVAEIKQKLEQSA